MKYKKIKKCDELSKASKIADDRMKKALEKSKKKSKPLKFR